LAVLILVPLGRLLISVAVASLARLSLPATPSLPPPDTTPHPSYVVSARHHGGCTAPELSSPTPWVVVTSGKGDISKTTAAANLAASLARLLLPIVPINASLDNLDLLLGLFM
jgi:septum site-determining protein MinD